MRRIAPLVLVALLAAACASEMPPGGGGGGGEQTGGEEMEPTTRVAGEEANDHGKADVSGQPETTLELGDVFFSPTVLAGEPGQTLTVSLENSGEIDHTFTIEDQGVDVTLRPGASDAAEVTFPDSGELLFVCRFHAEAGMRGGLSVGGAGGGGKDDDPGGGGGGYGDYG